MLDLCSLQSLFFSQIEESSPIFDITVYQFLQSHVISDQDILEIYRWEEPYLSEEIGIQNWQHLLSVNILCDLMQSHQQELASKVRVFERHPWNQSSQYFRSLIALNHALAKMPIPEVGPHLLESGAALIDLYEYCPWLSLPYTPRHFEFGIYLTMLGLITKRSDLQDIVLRIANWQLNTLNVHAQPMSSLFVREKEGKTLQHLCLSYLLFKSAALLKEETPFAELAELSLRNVQTYLQENDEKIDPLWVLLEEWLNQHQSLSRASLELPEHIYDPSTALVGYRSSTQHVVCTLHGMQTGLGELRFDDVEIVNYGPQYLPLGECDGFGIEGNALSDHGMRRSMIEWRRGTFILKGCTRLVDQPTSSSLGGCNFRGIWLEVVQEFKKPHFYLKTSFLGLDGWDGVAFSFFVKASRCKIQSQTLHPRTLDRYQGEEQTILLEGKEGSVELHPLGFKGTMQIIPLAGGNNFWGADFLIAYLMTPDQRQYQWHIGPPLN